MALAVPLSRFTSRVGGGSAFFVRQHYAPPFMKTSESTHTATQLEELRALRRPSFVTYLLPYFLAAMFGLIIWQNGRSYAVVFFAALTVSFTLHSISERRSRREIDLVLTLLDAEQKAK